MALPLYIPVIESEKALKLLLKRQSQFLAPRIKMLLAMKKAGEQGISKRELQQHVGCCSQSIQTWRSLYKEEGIDKLLSHKITGYKPSSFTAEEDLKLKDLMHDPTSNIKGYKELQAWVKKEFNKEIKYNTLLKYMVSKFNTSVKVARKSHIRKDKQAVEDLKKTSVKSASKPRKTIVKTSKS